MFWATYHIWLVFTVCIKCMLALQRKSGRKSVLTCLVQVLSQGLYRLIQKERKKESRNSLSLTLISVGNTARASLGTHLALSASLTALNRLWGQSARFRHPSSSPLDPLLTRSGFIRLCGYCWRSTLGCFRFCFFTIFLSLSLSLRPPAGCMLVGAFQLQSHCGCRMCQNVSKWKYPLFLFIF